MLAIKLVCSFMKDRAKYVLVIFTSLIHGPKVSSLDTHTHTTGRVFKITGIGEEL